MKTETLLLLGLGIILLLGMQEECHTVNGEKICSTSWGI